MSFSQMFYELARQMDEVESAFQEAWNSSSQPSTTALPSTEQSGAGRSGSRSSSATTCPDGSCSGPAGSCSRSASSCPVRRCERTGQVTRRPQNSSSLVSPLSSLFGSSDMLTSFPSMDVRQTADSVIVEANVPGYRKRDLKMTVHERSLTLSGENREESSETDEERGYSRRERRYGQFTRTVNLPCDVKPEGVRATCENGVVRVTLPKTPEAVGQEIAFDGEDTQPAENSSN